MEMKWRSMSSRSLNGGVPSVRMSGIETARKRPLAVGDGEVEDAMASVERLHCGPFERERLKRRVSVRFNG
jgi:hypothetical protein